jgi:hypothetical protein
MKRKILNFIYILFSIFLVYVLYNIFIAKVHQQQRNLLIYISAGIAFVILILEIFSSGK